MQNRDYTKTIEFLKSFFGDAEGVIELRACPNERGAWNAQSIFTNDPAALSAFCEQKDVPGGAVYFGVCTRREGAISGGKEAVRQCTALWADIDCAKQGIGGDEAIRALEFLPHPPSFIVISGAGLHAYWLLEEPVDVSTPERYRPIEALCRQLALILAGDTACAEAARVLRLPGTHNSKDTTKALNGGQAIECEVHSATGRVHDLDQIAEWLAEQRPVLKGCAAPQMRPVQEDNAYLTYAREAGYNPSIDIDEELAAMEHGATGDRSIHMTQIRVAYSMIARGYQDDEIVSRLLAATEAAAPSNVQWNWTLEERNIRRDLARARPKQAATPRRAAQPFQGNAALKLVHSAEEEPKSKRRAKSDEDERQTHIVAVGRAVIRVWGDRYGPIMHTAGTTYTYEDGIWTVWSDAHAQRLRAMIQEACQSLHLNPTSSLTSSAKAYVMDRPELHRDEVEFDAHGLLIADDGVLDFTTMEVRPHAPEHYALFKVAAKLNGNRECPAWEAFLAGAFSDRGVAKDIISTLQEWYGVSIAVTRSRPLLKGMLVHGASRTGKTQVSEVMRAILGEKHICNARMRDLEGRFGLEPLIGRRGWIADDAIGAKEYLDAETYKVIVTGEKTSAQMKGGKNIEVRFGFPVMLTANNLPRVNDKSDATYNRSLILPMTVVRPESAPEPEGYDSIAKKIAAEELTGVLWWAIEGRRRLLDRGRFDPPSVMLDAGRSFQDSNDPIGSWIRQCVEPSRGTKIARKDLATSFNGWWAMESDDGKPFSANSITREIQSRFPAVDPSVKTQGERMFGGIRLNDEGLFAWESLVRSAGYDKRPAYSTTREEVNRYWDGDPGGTQPTSSKSSTSAPAKERNLAKSIF